MLVAARYPVVVGAVVSIQGNFTLNDAFWSANLGRLTAAEATKEIAVLRDFPAKWVGNSMPNPSEEQVSSAIDWLNFQPVSTLKAIGRLFLETTDVPENLDTSRAVLENVSVSLIAGERSRSECDVPEWAISGARSFHVISGAGHLVPIEPPVEIATLINAASLAVELEA